MKRKKIPALLVIVLLSSCQIFLGPDPGDSPQEIFDSIWNDFNETYALFEVRRVDWDNIYKIYSPRIQPDMNSYRLFRVCTEMLNELDDPHAGLRTPFNNLTTQESFDVRIITSFDNETGRDTSGQEYVISKLENGGVFAGDNMFLYGTFMEKPNVGYIYIKGFSFGKEDSDFASGPVQEWVKKIDGILQSLAKTDYIILDICGNGGGLSSNAEYIAGRFISVQRDYIKTYTKNGPARNDFSSPVTGTVKPAGTRYTKPVVLLTDNMTTSAAERFTLALRTQNHIIHAGETTRGAFSAKIIRPLINGWEYTMSVQKVTDIKGIIYEGTGIPPDAPIAGTWEEQIDQILDFPVSAGVAGMR